MTNELITRIKGEAYIDVYLVSSGKIIDHLITTDRGQLWLYSKKLDKAFILPDRSEGLSFNRKTIFFYGAETSTPLTIEEQSEIEHQDEEYMYGIDSQNRLVRAYTRLIKSPDNVMNISSKTRKIKPASIKGTTIEPETLRGLINAKVVDDLLKPVENKWEQLKMPIIIGILAIAGIVFFYTV